MSLIEEIYEYNREVVGLIQSCDPLPKDIKGSYESSRLSKRYRNSPISVLKEQNKKSCRSIISAFSPNRNTVRFNSDEDGGSYTDGKKVMVCQKDINETDVETYGADYLYDVVCGLSVHELCHLLYTDFEVVNAKVDAMRGSYNEAIVKSTFRMYNIIEDARIEKTLLSDKPGLFPFISALTQKYQFKEREEDSKYKPVTEIEDSLEKGMYILHYSVSVVYDMFRANTFTDEEVLNDFKWLVDFIKTEIDRLPDTSEEAMDFAKSIMTLVRAHLPEDFDDKLEDLKNEKEEEFKEFMDKLKDILDKLKSSDDIDSGERMMSDKSDSDDGSESNPIEKTGLDNSDLGLPTVYPRTKFIRLEPDSDTYSDAYNEIKSHINRVNSKFTFFNYSYSEISKGELNGKLDTNKFPDILAGSKAVYEKTILSESTDYAVCLLIDESGSMHGDEIDLARKTAILLYESLKRFTSIELFIYGHTADYTFQGEMAPTAITVYKERGNFNKNMLGAISSRCNNRDGHAIREVAARVRSLTDRPCLMFVLSDGMPSAFDYESGITDTRQATLQAEKQKIYPVQIAFGNYNTSIKSEDMFSRYLKLEDMQDLPKQLSKILHKLTRKIIYNA